MYYLSNQCITFPKLAMSYVFIINGWRTQYSGAAEGHLYFSGKVGGGIIRSVAKKGWGLGKMAFHVAMAKCACFHGNRSDV